MSSSETNEESIKTNTKSLIFDLLKEKKLEDAVKFIQDGELKEIDCVDEHGTTPLQYAAFRGWIDICELLISKGADVNAKTHDQGYTALMFAAISNHKSVAKLLLDNEADVDYTNMIGRTASQMAGFVNSNECVDLINSYVSKQALGYFTEIHSINETEPKLPKECFSELHKLLTVSSDYSPIRILKSIKMSKDNALMVNADKIIKTLDSFCSKSFKNENGDCPNDLLAFKLHLYKYYFEYVLNMKKSLIKKAELSNQKDDNNQDIESKSFEFCFKQLISQEEVEIEKGSNKVKKMHRVFEEKFLRESIRQFPYVECALVRQLVTILFNVKIGNHPSALYTITSCLNGQRLNESFDNNSSLDETGEKKENKRVLLECASCYLRSLDNKWCTHCKKVSYCDQVCQRLHWPYHKKEIL